MLEKGEAISRLLDARTQTYGERGLADDGQSSDQTLVFDTTEMDSIGINLPHLRMHRLLKSTPNFSPTFEALGRGNLGVCEDYFPVGQRDREKDKEAPNVNTAAPRIMAILDTRYWILNAAEHDTRFSILDTAEHDNQYSILQSNIGLLAGEKKKVDSILD